MYVNMRIDYADFIDYVKQKLLIYMKVVANYCFSAIYNNSALLDVVFARIYKYYYGYF